MYLKTQSRPRNVCVKWIFLLRTLCWVSMDESIKAFLSMSPYEKNVVNKSFPDSWCWSVSVYKLVFKPTHKGVGKRGCHSSSHGCPTNLEVVFFH